MAKPIIAIVGRPNVGKSTLFNKLIGERRAIIEDTPGVTRDRIYGEGEWCGKSFVVIDTGGIEPKTNDVILKQMRLQAEIAIDTADVIIFMCDVRTGLVADDREIAVMLKKSGKPVVVAVNKADSVGAVPFEFYEFYELGFDKDAKQWAGVLYETLEQSDAINKYRTYFETHRPDYSGDGSFSGDVEYGTDYDNQIDISRFVDPGTKNNLDLAAYAVQAWENNWGYVWGTYGNILTPSLFAYKKQQYPDGVGNHADFIESHWLGRRTADCIGLIKGYGWLDTKSMAIGYAANGMPDYGADQMYRVCKNAGVQNEDYGPISTLPELPGLMLWKSGHAGVYIGGSYAIEAMGTRKGVVKTKVSDRGWQGWGKLPYIDYREER